MLKLIRKSLRRFLCLASRRRFAAKGVNILFDPLSSEFTYEKIYLGSDVFIGSRAYFRSSHSRIKIGSHVMFGPNVYILGGDHIHDVVGSYMIENRKNEDHIDDDIIVKDDVWVGASTIILPGVTISTGSIIAAGSVVTKNTEPYGIYAGVPCKKIKDRFNNQELKEHIELLKQKKL